MCCATAERRVFFFGDQREGAGETEIAISGRRTWEVLKCDGSYSVADDFNAIIAGNLPDHCACVCGLIANVATRRDPRKATRSRTSAT